MSINAICIDWESGINLTPEDIELIQQAYYFRVGDFDLVDTEPQPKEPWLERWLDKQDASDFDNRIDNWEVENGR